MTLALHSDLQPSFLCYSTNKISPQILILKKLSHLLMLIWTSESPSVSNKYLLIELPLKVSLALDFHSVYSCGESDVGKPLLNNDDSNQGKRNLRINFSKWKLCSVRPTTVENQRWDTGNKQGSYWVYLLAWDVKSLLPCTNAETNEVRCDISIHEHQTLIISYCHFHA